MPIDNPIAYSPVRFPHSKWSTATVSNWSAPPPPRGYMANQKILDPLFMGSVAWETTGEAKLNPIQWSRTPGLCVGGRRREIWEFRSISTVMNGVSYVKLF